MNKLILLTVDPYQIHAYWEVAPDKLADAVHQAEEGARAILRFYDVANTGSWFDVEVQPESRNWYVRLWAPGRSYYAELGFRSVDRQFVAMVKSNVVHLPRAWPVVAVEEQFVRVEPPTPTATPSVANAEPEPVPATEAIPPSLPEPIDSADLLKKKLTELYAFRQWLGEPPKRNEAAPPVIEFKSEFKKETGIDLTAEAERAFTMQASSNS